MRDWTRRNVLKTGIVAAGAALVPPGIAWGAEGPGEAGASAEPPETGGVVVAASSRERLLLDAGWRFLLGHGAAPGPDVGGNANGFSKGGDLFAPSDPKFDVGAWHQVDLPHDWAVDLPFVHDDRLVNWGFKPLSRAYPETSIGWYRRVIAIPSEDAGRRLCLEFDGVFRDCTVALNGHLLGRNLSGYAPFRFDITDVAVFGGDNVLVVRVDATEHEGWFYEGAGIYRHVWLTKTSPVHVAHWGTYVTSQVTAGGATVSVATEIANESDAAVACTVVQAVVDAAGRTLASARSAALRVDAGASGEARQQMQVAAPVLWSPDAPHLYTLDTTLEAGGVEVDRYETPFGIRTAVFDAERGFLLNGQRLQINGTCNHQDHAGVGAALPDRLQHYRIERLKEMGCNAYRASHNPPTPELLDACDRLGMLVLDETRMFGSSGEALDELERLIRRDRNRPSVIAWSILNEEPAQGTERGARIARTMTRLVRRLDPTRPVSVAMDNSWGTGAATAVDLQGFNYRAPQTDEFHRAHPGMPAWGTEMGSTVSTRGIYENDKDRGYLSAYDVNAPWWASTAEAWWTHFAARKWLSGAFVWTGFDYRGEPTPYGWPCISSHFGVLDTCGFPKDNFYYYQAWWSGKPVLHLFPHWNWAGREGQEVEVWCHTNLERVELLLNGRSMGVREVARNSHAMWKVPYTPGRLEARGFRGGQRVLVDVRETTGPAARVLLVPDRSRIAADGEDVSVVAAQVVDARGRVVPTADHEITFRIAGAG
ncbi:MAG TPA: beta-galactosidase GalA, partial [Longimicrobiaceae bacterium]|nr:beta-galactosidase GalA [Longimicrobiaceae bacterium]